MGVAERREDLRASDADREFVAEHLKAALNEGRLSLLEYDERLRDAYAAKTYGDLDRLLDDLPGVVPTQHSQVERVAAATPAPPPPPSDPPPASDPSAAATVPADTGSRPLSRWIVGVWSAWLIAVSVNVVIWLLVMISAGHWVYFWPMWVAGPWGAVLLAITVSGVARGEPHRHHGTSYQEQWEYRMRRRAEHWERHAARRQARWERRMGRYR